MMGVVYAGQAGHSNVRERSGGKLRAHILPCRLPVKPVTIRGRGHGREGGCLVGKAELSSNRTGCLAGWRVLHYGTCSQQRSVSPKLGSPGFTRYTHPGLQAPSPLYLQPHAPRALSWETQPGLTLEGETPKSLHSLRLGLPYYPDWVPMKNPSTVVRTR